MKYLGEGSNYKFHAKLGLLLVFKPKGNKHGSWNLPTFHIHWDLFFQYSVRGLWAVCLSTACTFMQGHHPAWLSGWAGWQVNIIMTCQYFYKLVIKAELNKLYLWGFWIIKIVLLGCKLLFQNHVIMEGCYISFWMSLFLLQLIFAGVWPHLAASPG